MYTNEVDLEVFDQYPKGNKYRINSMKKKCSKTMVVSAVVVTLVVIVIVVVISVLLVGRLAIGTLHVVWLLPFLVINPYLLLGIFQLFKRNI